MVQLYYIITLNRRFNRRSMVMDLTIKNSKVPVEYLILIQRKLNRTCLKHPMIS